MLHFETRDLLKWREGKDILIEIRSKSTRVSKYSADQTQLIIRKNLQSHLRFHSVAFEDNIRQ